MADIPRSWGVYARLQSKLSGISSITFSDALEAALNVVHEPGFSAEALVEADMFRRAANAARQERHRSSLRLQVQAAGIDAHSPAHGNDDGGEPTGASSLADQLHARRELRHIASRLADDDWDLLTGAAAGVPYDELAVSHASTSTALRSRVCRLRQALMVRRSTRRQA